MDNKDQIIPLIPGRRLRALRRIENWLITIAFTVVLVAA
jgi:hypothetical protein